MAGSSEHCDGPSGVLYSAVSSALPPTTHFGLSGMAMTNVVCPAKNRTRVFPPVSGSWHQPGTLRGLPGVWAVRSDGNHCHAFLKDWSQQPVLAVFGPTAAGSATEQAHFSMAFFTVNIPHGFTVHENVQPHLRPQN